MGRQKSPYAESLMRVLIAKKVGINSGTQQEKEILGA